MHITLSPVRHDFRMMAEVHGDRIVIDNIEPEPITLDFTDLPEGAMLPEGATGCQWIVGPVRRIDGEIHLTLLLPHGPIPLNAPPEVLAVTHPEPILVTADGPIKLPSYTPAEETEQ